MFGDEREATFRWRCITVLAVVAAAALLADIAWLVTY